MQLLCGQLNEMQRGLPVEGKPDLALKEQYCQLSYWNLLKFVPNTGFVAR